MIDSAGHCSVPGALFICYAAQYLLSFDSKRGPQGHQPKTLLRTVHSVGRTEAPRTVVSLEPARFPFL